MGVDDAIRAAEFVGTKARLSGCIIIRFHRSRSKRKKAVADFPKREKRFCSPQIGDTIDFKLFWDGF